MPVRRPTPWSTTACRISTSKTPWNDWKGLLADAKARPGQISVGATLGSTSHFFPALIEKAAGIKSGSAKPHTDKVGKITRAQAEEIAKTKMPDLTAADMDAAVRTIAGSARSMGITVEGL